MRDTATLSDVFVQIDKDVAQKAKDVAAARNINLWQVVEEQLNLLPEPVTADEGGQEALIEVPEEPRKKAS